MSSRNFCRAWSGRAKGWGISEQIKNLYDVDILQERLQVIQVRKGLTDEWDAHGVQKGVEYAILHGALLRMNRSIQAERAFGSMKWNRSYTRVRRRGLDGLLLETALISCGFNLHKFYGKSLAKQYAA